MAKPTETLRNRALRLLSRREYSRAELKAKLLLYDKQAELESLLDSLQEKDWLSDKRFAEEWVRQRSLRYGRQRLQYELGQKGIEPELITASLHKYLQDEVAQARLVWQKKYGLRAISPQEKAKQIRFLQYRGYDWDIIQQILDRDDYD